MFPLIYFLIKHTFIFITFPPTMQLPPEEYFFCIFILLILPVFILPNFVLPLQSFRWQILFPFRKTRYFLLLARIFPLHSHFYPRGLSHSKYPIHWIIQLHTIFYFCLFSTPEYFPTSIFFSDDNLLVPRVPSMQLLFFI